METIKTYHNRDIDLKKSLIRVGDLINLDGPLLSLFLDNRNNDLYVFDWVDSDDEQNRWLIYKVDAKFLNQFIEDKISYKDLFNVCIKSTFFYYADIVNSKESEYEIYKLDNIDSDYFPTDDIFFEKHDSKDLANITNTISRILFRQNDEDTFILNRLNFYEGLIAKHQPLFFDLNQNVFFQLKHFSESNNILPVDLTNNIEAQKNVRENNRLPAKKELDLHFR